MLFNRFMLDFISNYMKTYFFSILGDAKLSEVLYLIVH